MGVPDVVFAQPERLARWAALAAAVAEGLDVRRAALAAAVARHRLRTAAAYRVDGDALVDEVRALARHIEDLGAWVAEVGRAFAAAGHGIDGRFAATPAALAAAVPVPRAVPPVEPGPTGPAPGPSALAAAGSSRADGGAAARAGLAEALARWHAEGDRPPLERAGRALLDGALNAGGAYLGASHGAAVGAALCGPTEVGVLPCVAAGGVLGGWLGRQAGEWLSDRILGDEPDADEVDPDAVAAAIGRATAADATVLRPEVEAAAAEAAAAADRHARFVARHPWVADAAAFPPPPPDGVLLRPAGPR